MATSIDVSVTETKDNLKKRDLKSIPKLKKKEKSTKKRKAESLDEDSEKSVKLSDPSMPNEEPVPAPKLKKDKSSKKRKAESFDDALQKSTELASTPDGEPVPTPKSKKDKSSKKRKAETLDQTSQSDIKLEDRSLPEDTAGASLEPTLNDAEEHSTQPLTKKRKASVEEIEVDITAPEPPSKKALRRLKKGKPLPPSKSGAESTPEPEKKPAKKTEVEKRSEHGIWIGNLPWHLSKEDLRKFFVEYSDITEEMITRVHMPTPNDGKPANKVEEKKKFVKAVNNQGYAYVDFNCPEAVGYAIELSEQLLSGRRVLIKNNKSFEGRPQKTKEESRNDGKPPSKRVFLGNLTFDTTEESLKEHFEKCGAVANVKVAQFEDSGKCKGYAWITFEELEGAKNAVRGFVLIEEDVSDASESEPEDERSDSEIVSKPKTKKTKTRKWWVNKIKGRPLRMEFAEDAQVRYKKRYGKDGTKSRSAEAPEDAIDNVKAIEGAPKKVEYMLPHGSARLTGGIVESTGKKVTF